MSRPILVLVLLCPVALGADDPPAVRAARATHERELERLRHKLLDDMDAVIRKERDAGAGINYLLKERKGFADNGVVPLLPKLLPASRDYLAGKSAADEALAAALDRAGLKTEATALRPSAAAPAAGPARAQDVQTMAHLQKFLEDTVWNWGDGDLQLRWDGRAEHAGWNKAGLVTRWAAVDRRTVVLRVEKGRDHSVLAVLTFSDDLAGFRGLGFDGKPLTETRTRKR